MKAVFLDFATLGEDALDPASLQRICPDLEVFDNTPDELRIDRIRDAEIVLVNKVRLFEPELEHAKSLRFIGLTATGTDNIDLEYARNNGIAVCNITAYCTQSVVEHVFAVLLNLAHSIGSLNKAVRAGDWQRADEFCLLGYPIRELSAMTMGIVGYGELGGGVATMARNFGMNVIVARRAGAPASTDDGRCTLQELLRQSDVVSLHCPLNDATRGLIGADELAMMKDDAFLINTARGGLVDSTALAAALANGDIGGAGIDVLPQEPPVNGDPLLDYQGDNLIVTPHVAWATITARQNSLDELAKDVEAFLAGESLNRVV